MSYPFHLAFPVRDIEETRRFYRALGAREARSAERWIDFDFWGHQISAHLVEEMEASSTNEVDGDAVPVRHFGVVLPWEEWQRLKEQAGPFRIEPRIRFEGEVGEQATFFVEDPSGNCLEFKSFKDPTKLFATSQDV